MGIVVRSGNIADASWVVSLLREGAQLGHFSEFVGPTASPLVGEILTKGGFTIVKGRGGLQAPRFINATIKVADLDGEPASFLISLMEKNEVELHLAATRKQLRRKGCFSELTKNEIASHNPSIRIFARCYKKSTWAVEALQKEGFEITKGGDPVELTLSR